MDSVYLCVTFSIRNVCLPKKNYKINLSWTIRHLKSIIVLDLKSNTVQISDIDILNTGFRHEFKAHEKEYIDEHTLLSTIFADSNQPFDLQLKMETKRRLHFDMNLTTSDLIYEYNLLDRQLKFIAYVQTQNLKKIKLYLENGLDPNFMDPKSKHVPLFVWCRLCCTKKMEILEMLHKNGQVIDILNADGQTALQVAINRQDRQAVQLLLEKKAKTYQLDVRKVPTLFYALKNDVQVSILELILQNTKEFDFTDEQDQNMIHYCVKNRLINHLKVIINFFTHDPSLQPMLDKYMTSLNKSGNTPCHLAVVLDDQESLEILMKVNPPLDPKNRNGETVRELASKLGKVSLASDLCSTNTESKFSTLRKTQQATNIIHLQRSLQSKDSNIQDSVASETGYPPPYIVTQEYISKSDEELTLFNNDYVMLIMVLSSGVAFGYKQQNLKQVYGWFPCSAIGFNSKRIMKFQKIFGTLKNMTDVIPHIPKNVKFNIPFMVFINLDPLDNMIGMTLMERVGPKRNKKELEPLSNIATPFFVGVITSKSASERCGLISSDRIVYVMSNDVTTRKFKAVQDLIQQMSVAKVPKHLPKSSMRQIVLIVIRPGDGSTPLTQKTDKEGEVSSDQPCHMISSVSKLEYSRSVVINTQKDKKCKFKSDTLRGAIHDKPLPSLPPIHSESNLNPSQLKLPPDSQSLSSSLGQLPPPPPDIMLE